jgi:hypothetical protein
MTTNASPLHLLDEAARRAAVVQHLRYDGIDFQRSHAMYHEDAILEFPQSGERFFGASCFREWRERYPSTVAKRIRRISGGGEQWVTEVMLSYDGGPWVLGLSIDQFRGDRIARQIIYVMTPFAAPAWRAPWATRFDPYAAVDADEWVDGTPFGLDAELELATAG